MWTCVCNESMKGALLSRGTGEHKMSNGVRTQLASFARHFSALARTFSFFFVLGVCPF